MLVLGDLFCKTVLSESEGSWGWTWHVHGVVFPTSTFSLKYLKLLDLVFIYFPVFFGAWFILAKLSLFWLSARGDVERLFV